MTDALKRLLDDLEAENALLRAGKLRRAAMHVEGRERLIAAVEEHSQNEQEPDARMLLSRIDQANRENSHLRRAALEAVVRARDKKAAAYGADGGRIYPTTDRPMRRF